MKTAIIFAGSGPILVITSHDDLSDETFRNKMYQKGIKKYIYYEVDIEECKHKYGAHFQAILHDVKQDNDLRVLDFDGHNVFYSFVFKDLGTPVLVE